MMDGSAVLKVERGGPLQVQVPFGLLLVWLCASRCKSVAPASVRRWRHGHDL
jgi:hypothetical protein